MNHSYLRRELSTLAIKFNYNCGAMSEFYITCNILFNRYSCGKAIPHNEIQITALLHCVTNSQQIPQSIIGLKNIEAWLNIIAR